MRRVSTCLAYVGLCVGFFAAAHTVPSPRAAATVRAVVAGPVQVSRFAERAEIERVLAEGRAPVPFVREIKLTPYVPPDALEPSLAVFVPPVVATARALSANVRLEENRSGRMTAETRWRAAAAQGSTEMAVTATP